MNARTWLDKHNNKRIKKGLPPYELEYKEFTDKSDGLQYCYIEISVTCIETKYKSVFNGLNINN